MSKAPKVESILARISANAKGRRKAMRLSLQDVADRAGLAKSYVWEIESGRNTNPSISVVLALSGALGCSVSDLIGDEAFLKPQLRPEAMQIAVRVDQLLRSALQSQGAS